VDVCPAGGEDAFETGRLANLQLVLSGNVEGALPDIPRSAAKAP
jgi:hypothetical protein